MRSALDWSAIRKAAAELGHKTFTFNGEEMPVPLYLGRNFRGTMGYAYQTVKVWAHEGRLPDDVPTPDQLNESMNKVSAGIEAVARACIGQQKTNDELLLLALESELKTAPQAVAKIMKHLESGNGKMTELADEMLDAMQQISAAWQGLFTKALSPARTGRMIH